MLTKEQAQSIAANLNKVNGETAKIGQHKTNGKLRYQVHVTFPDHSSDPFTIGHKADKHIPVEA